MELDLEFVDARGAKRYTIASKIKVCEAIKAGEIKSCYAAEKQLNLGVATVTGWMRDYKSGKLSLDNTVSVTRKPKSVLHLKLAEAESKMNTAIAEYNELQQAITIITRLGIKVA